MNRALSRPRTKVLIVDDSRVAREYLTHILAEHPRIEVLDAVATGEAAVAYVEQRRPDIVLMDLHLPGIDGFEATRRIMASAAVPVVVCTAGTSFHEVRTAMEAISAGALAAVRKPAGPLDRNADADAAALVSTLILMAEVRVVRRWRRPAESPGPDGARGSVVHPEPQLQPPAAAPRGVDLVAIGASTGGPPALAAILSRLPADFAAPVLVVQHITAGFTEGFAGWLGGESQMPVRVAQDGERPQRGHVYVAGDAGHLRLDAGGRLVVAADGPAQAPCPSVGALFDSVAQRCGRRAVGVLLTGMGRDGARELGAMARAGALTIAQDEASSVVFGMPGEAIRLGAAQLILPPAAIADQLVRTVGQEVGR